MENETLTCTQCSSTWNRQKARGRKPKLCPLCTQTLQKVQEDLDEDEDLLPVIEEAPPSRTKYKAGTKWKCNSCGVSVKISIGINDPPTHPCKKRLKKVFALELQ